MADPIELQPEEIEGHIKDLLADYTPPADNPDPDPEANPPAGQGQPQGEPKPAGEAKPEGEGEVKPAEGEGEPKPAAAEPPKTEVKTYEYRGKQYTVEQMIELGILEDALQTARQFPTIQTKYQQLLEQAKLGGQPAPQQGQPAQPASQGPTPEQILAAYVPVAEKVAEQGYIEKEAIEAFPRLVSALMQHRDLLYDVRQVVAVMLQRDAQRGEVDARTTFVSFLDNTCDKVAGEGEHFALIKDPKVREGFYQYLATLNIPAKDVNADFIKRQWIAYNSETVLEAARTAADTRKGEDAKARRNAAGEGGGPRPAAPAKVAKTADAALIDSFLDGDKRFAVGG